MFDNDELLHFAQALDPRVDSAWFHSSDDRFHFEFLDEKGNSLYGVRIERDKALGNILEILETVKDCLTIEHKLREAFKMPDYSEQIQQLIDEGTDAINHPPHYNQYSGVEVIDITEKLNFNRGNAVKYIARAGFKSQDTEIQDLTKALWYVDREIKNKYHDATLAILSFEDAQKLVEQMNYNRGTAVWLIALAGRRKVSASSTINEDLTEAKYAIEHEIERLTRYASESDS